MNNHNNLSNDDFYSIPTPLTLLHNGHYSVTVKNPLTHFGHYSDHAIICFI